MMRSLVDMLANHAIVTAVANTASILGLAATVYAVWRINGIRRQFMRTARLPQLLEDVGTHVSRLNGLLNSRDRTATEAEFGRCRATMASVASIASGASQRSAKDIQARLAGFRQHQSDEIFWAGARQAYADLAELETLLRNLHEETKWS